MVAPSDACLVGQFLWVYQTDLSVNNSLIKINIKTPGLS